MLSVRSHTKENPCVIPTTWKDLKGQIYKVNQVAWEVEPGNDYNQAGDGDGNDLKLDRGNGCTTLHTYQKITEMHTWK